MQTVSVMTLTVCINAQGLVYLQDDDDGQSCAPLSLLAAPHGSDEEDDGVNLEDEDKLVGPNGRTR